MEYMLDCCVLIAKNETLHCIAKQIFGSYQIVHLSDSFYQWQLAGTTDVKDIGKLYTKTYTKAEIESLFQEFMATH